MLRFHNFAEIHIQNDLKMATVVTEKMAMVQETQVVMVLETQEVMVQETPEVMVQETQGTGMITEIEVWIQEKGHRLV